MKSPHKDYIHDPTFLHCALVSSSGVIWCWNSWPYILSRWHHLPIKCKYSCGKYVTSVSQVSKQSCWLLVVMIVESSHAMLWLVLHTCSAQADFGLLELETALLWTLLGIGKYFCKTQGSCSNQLENACCILYTMRWLRENIQLVQLRLSFQKHKLLTMSAQRMMDYYLFRPWY